MRGTTHIAAGLLAAAALNLNIPCSALVVVGALAPDIDLPTSKISRRTSGLPSLFLEHRGITHSAAFVLLTNLLSMYLAIGAATHLALDMLNPMGISIVWPIKRRVSIGKICSNGLMDTVIGMLLFAGFIYIMYTRYK